MQKRRLVKIVKMRIMDAEIGDVVHRDEHSDLGWFVVASKERMFNNDLQLSDHTTYVTISGSDYDMIAVQVVTEVDLPAQPRVELPEAREGAS